MRQAVVNLIEAVRGLRLARSSGTHGVRIELGAADLAPNLLATLEALEAVERDGGDSVDEELAKVKMGLEGVFRWIRLQGLDTDEPLEILARAMGGRPPRKHKAPASMPTFAPNFAKRKQWKPKLSLAQGLGSDNPRTLEEHRKVAFVMDQVRASLGDAVLPKATQAEMPRMPGAGPF